MDKQGPGPGRDCALASKAPADPISTHCASMPDGLTAASADRYFMPVEIKASSHSGDSAISSSFVSNRPHLLDAVEEYTCMAISKAEMIQLYPNREDDSLP